MSNMEQIERELKLIRENSTYGVSVEDIRSQFLYEFLKNNFKSNLLINEEDVRDFENLDEEGQTFVLCLASHKLLEKYSIEDEIKKAVLIDNNRLLNIAIRDSIDSYKNSEFFKKDDIVLNHIYISSDKYNNLKVRPVKIDKDSNTVTLEVLSGKDNKLFNVITIDKDLFNSQFTLSLLD